MQNYKRVLPRDLFNEAKLLKCMGKLTLLIEDKMKAVDGLSYYYDGHPFIVCQNEMDGSIFLSNVELHSENGSNRIVLASPLNSKAAWPLQALVHDDSDLIAVFTEDGEINPEFMTEVSRQP